MANIVILEDDVNLNEGIKIALDDGNKHFFQCRKIAEARHILLHEEVDLLLLDLNLPDGQGMSFLREVRYQYDFPIIIITANHMESDIVIGLEAGANDYVTKPFSLMVLRARVAVQLRKNKTVDQYKTENFNFDFRKMLFTVHNKPVDC